MNLVDILAVVYAAGLLPGIFVAYGIWILRAPRPGDGRAKHQDEGSADRPSDVPIYVLATIFWPLGLAGLLIYGWLRLARLAATWYIAREVQRKADAARLLANATPVPLVGYRNDEVAERRAKKTGTTSAGEGSAP